MNKLTNREMEILGYVAKGQTNVEISDFLKISENTVKVHIANIYKKLNITNRMEAALYCTNNKSSGGCNNTICYIKPLLIVEPFSYNNNLANITEDDNLPIQLQNNLLIGLSRRNIFSIVKANMAISKNIDTMIGYRISGSIHKRSNKITATVYLESHPQCLQIWSHKFDKTSDDFTLDLLTNQIIASLMYNLISKEASVALELEISQITIFQNLMLGFHLSNLADSQPLLKAQLLFDSILELIPANIAALYGKGLIAYVLIITDVSKNPAADYLIVKNCSISLNATLKNCVECWFMRGLLALLDQDVKGAAILFHNALHLDSSRQETFVMLAQLYTALGDYTNAKIHLENSILLCPDFHDRGGRNVIAMSIVYFGIRQYEDAIRLLEKNSYVQEENIFSTLLYICSLYHAGYTQKACDLSKNIHVSQQYIERIFTLSNEDILNRLLTAFHHMGINIVEK